MPKPDYGFQASVIVAASGPEAGTTAEGPLGLRVSRDGARLPYTGADARAWETQLADGHVATHTVLLFEPTVEEVRAAIRECHSFLDGYGRHKSWHGGQVNFVFAGHGTTVGDLVLSNGKLTPSELMEELAHSTAGSERIRRVALVLDSCYSGLTLVKMLTHEAHHETALLIDGFAAAMHDERAWEIPSLGHGALSYTMTKRTPLHIGGGSELALAIETQDEESIRRLLYRAAPNPVSYLTQAEQHSLDLINGHGLSIRGLGSLDIGKHAEVDAICGALTELRSSPDYGSANMKSLP